MTLSHFNMMQMAVDIVQTSSHPTNKIAVSIAGTCKDGESFTIARTNEQPETLKPFAERGEKIGSASPTIHAEMATIIDAPCTDGANIYITDPPCPNCAKYIAEAGFSDVYIDHKGFEKDFYERRRDSVTLSFDILEDAGISVHKVYRKDEIIETLIQADLLDSVDQSGYLIKPLTEPYTPAKMIEKAQRVEGTPFPFVVMAARDKSGKAFSLYAEPSRHGTKHDTPCGKYSLTIQPLNRAYMLAARHGLTIDRASIVSSHVPTSREFVNSIGADITTIHILDEKNARDESSMQAFKSLKDAGALNIQQ